MMMKSTFPFAAAALIAAGFGFFACHRQTPEELLREWVREVGVRIEKRDVRGLLDRLDPAYVDSTGRSREETGKMLEAYFAKFSGIVVHVLSSRSELVSAGSAAIEADAAVSSGGAEALRRLIRFSGECYRFRGRLQRSGSGWRAVYAEWEAIERENLFPDSVEMLRKIFPRL